MSTPLRRREEEITADYLLVTPVTNAVVQATILHLATGFLSSRVSVRAADVLSILQMNAKNCSSLARNLPSSPGFSEFDDRLIVYERNSLQVRRFDLCLTNIAHCIFYDIHHPHVTLLS